MIPVSSDSRFPATIIFNNTIYDSEHKDRFILNGRKMHVETEAQMTNYHVNMAAILQLGRWMDYLRNQGVYDNTRIIIVADHGRGAVQQFDDMEFKIGAESCETSLYIMRYNPLLLVKDYDSQDFTIDNTFMTNGDVPTVAVDGLIANPTNPFTHKPINNQAKYLSNQLIINSTWDISINNGNTFLSDGWYSVHDNLFDPNNWEIIGEH